MTLEQKIARINELYKKSKSSEGLTEAEKSEQALLRKEYIDNVRQNLRNQLNNINIQDEDGSIENLGERYGSKTRSNRALGKQNREQLSEESRFHKSRKIAENLMATAVWKQAKQVLLYASYGSEVSTGLLMDAALAAGKEVFLPKVLGDQMEFFRITDRAELAPGYQHILEPPGQTKRFCRMLRFRRF